MKHRTIANLGRLDDLIADNTLQTIGLKLLELSESPVVSLYDVCEIDRICYGNIAYEKLWNRLGLDSIIDSLMSRDQKLAYDVKQVLKFTVIHKLLQGTSKLDSFLNKGKYFGLGQGIQLHHIYSSMDFLSEHKDKLELALFNKGRNLFNNEIDVAFYDVTTFHFESNRADELKDFGFSKAGKVNEVQVVLGLFTDRQGVPIGYELFSGSTFDGKTMVSALQILSQRFHINKIIIVADKGLNDKNNFHLIRQAGYDYIVASRLKSQSRRIKDMVFDGTGYQVSNIDEQTSEVTFQYKTVDLNIQYWDEQKVKHQWTDKLLITWSSKRANKANKDRERQIEKANKFIAGKAEMINRKGARRYVKIDDPLNAMAINLDQGQIDKDAKWDGYYGIQFSNPKLSQNEVLEAYKGLWHIEESFRIMKSTMKVRSIFHWTPKRIKGHFMMCFIGFLLERHLEIQLKEKELPLSTEKIKRALNKLQLSIVTHRNDQYYMKSANGQYGAKILRALNIKPIPNVQRITQ